MGDALDLIPLLKLLANPLSQQADKWLVIPPRMGLG